MTVMTARAATAYLTAEQFLAQDHPTGSELIDGVVHVNDPNFRHQRLCLRICHALLRWSGEADGRGEVGWGGNWVLTDQHVYKPDVWWTATRPEGTRHDGPPDLAVEVRSPGTWHLDIGPKLDVYRAAGTREVWLVDTPAHTVLAYRADDEDGFELGPGEQLTSPQLPGFALLIDELFAD